jgi:hypothetical protein
MIPQEEMSDDIFQIVQEPKPVRAGRPQSLDDSTLRNRRDRLLAIFEASWGEMGWKIQKSREADELASIFNALPGVKFQDVIAVFCTRSTLPASDAALSKARKEMRALVTPQRESANLLSHANERLQGVQRALPQAKGRELKLVRKELVKRKQEADKVAADCRRINEKQRSIAIQVQLLEASIAQRELFRFLKSKRYELNPLSLANAAAGLPNMGWRRSLLRCVKAGGRSLDGLRYEVFKTIRYLVSTARNKTQQVLIAHFRERIPLLPQRYRHSKTELAENWFFLERALRQSCKAKPHPGALPFEITQRYFNQTQTKSYTHMLLAERTKLNLESAKGRKKKT